MKTRLDKSSWLLTRPAAHRGLHGNGVSENSLKAFSLAVEGNYPIELDLQLTADDKIVVVHDENLKRLTDTDVDVRDMPYDEIVKLKLSDGQHIPLFDEVLELVAGKVPLLTELKQQKREGLESAAISRLSQYKGEFAIQSFDPRMMMKVKKLAPEVIRGQLGCGRPENQSALNTFIIRNLSLNFLVKPDFINYDLGSFPIKKHVSNGLPVIGWTVRSAADKAIAERYCDSYVFERY